MTAENEGAKIYRAALYLRLSRDESGAYESSSIISQKKLLADYIKEKRDLEIFGVYCDDGYSGVDFDRPDFLRMLADIYEGHVSCVIVKDFSRLGRDYIDTGYYIEKFFPDYNVRYIAILDDVDNFDVEKYGKAIEYKTDLFPNKTNVTFAQVIDRNTLKMREWEKSRSDT